jgi:putative transport protein
MQFLIDNPLLTLVLTIALGAAVGLIRFGPLRFGAAGALFVGLFIGAFDTEEVIGSSLSPVKTLGLALFVYMVGLEAGRGLVRSLRTQLGVMAASLVALTVVAGAMGAVGGLLGVGGTYQGGSYSGIGTSTGALGAAQAAAASAAGGDEALASRLGGEVAVGYSIAYPFGVIIGILMVFVAYRRTVLSTPQDPVRTVGGLVDVTVVVRRAARLSQVPGAAEGTVRFSYLSRAGRDAPAMGVAKAIDAVSAGDRVVVIGRPEAVDTAVGYLGQRADRHLADDQSVVAYRRVLLSDPTLAERTVGDLDIPGRFGGVVTRVRRGDADILATDDLILVLGDRLRVVAPRERMREVSAFLGDTERRISEVDAVALFLGLGLGFLVGIPGIPVGQGTLALGSAGGPIVVGIVLGYLGRTGRLVWAIPMSANLTLRQFGLLTFLAAVGLGSGYDFRANAFTLLGLKILALSIVMAVLGLGLMTAFSRLRRHSTPREAGLLAGFVGNPSIIGYAQTRSADPRVGEGYGTLFALTQVFKIIGAQVLVVLGLR